ncbi:hypothetical protein MVEN_02265000 [Mycena venus]|uniref:Uncharacterized protein n=1 Tax=Mycena venus TaxID=2733690 RepID=A0A8H7CEY4_9AGAR|nr:hypothetical protein MVEN_02265000 [Mycena venus]
MITFLILSLVVLVSLAIPTVSLTNTSIPHIPYFHIIPLRLSSWQELATSHIYIPLILLASALGWFIGSSFWSPPRGVSSSVVHGSFCSSPLPPTTPAPSSPPVFDSQQPRDLPKYFSDLNFLLSCSRITDNSEKKYHATRFLTLDDQDLWESVPEFSDPAASLEQFAAAIFHLYPEADPDHRYSLADLDALVTELSCMPSLSRLRFLEFYRRFFIISTFLVAKNRLSTPEQSRSFLRAIPPTDLAFCTVTFSH